MLLNTLSESEITTTFFALALLLFFSFIVGKLFETINAPKVVGEIVGGILLGNTLLAFFFPNIMGSIFSGFQEEGKVLNIFYQLGLTLLMFSSGFNTKIDLERKNVRIFGALFIGSTIIPMLLGIPFINIFSSGFIGEANNSLAFSLVFLIGIAITSIPVISKIFFDMGIISSRFANIVLTASTLQDLCLWILLNMAIEFVGDDSISIGKLFIVIILTILLFIIVKVLGEYFSKKSFSIASADFMQASFIVLCLGISLLSILKINLMYSSFLVGYLVKGISNNNATNRNIVNNISNFSFSFFVPIYFALVGIQLDLIHKFSILSFLSFFVISFLLEGFGTVLVLGLFTKLHKRTVINFGIAMNARGGPGIVLATVAYNYKIINVEFFTVLILTTMVSSLIAGYWLRAEQKRDENVFNNL